jgi:murein DD-endopeptidase MepM/ murein hydrolase activator NlpD
MTRRRHPLPLAALFASFCAGMILEWVLQTYGPPKPAFGSEIRQQPATATISVSPPAPSATGSSGSSSTTPPPAVSGTSGSGRSNGAMPTIGSTHQLRPPIDGARVEAWKGGFAEHRGKRPHEAVDILAPRHTAVHAVDDGTIARLFVSKAGGNTIYQFDRAGDLCYYYAHLQRYADGIHAGQAVSRGDVIGYVGTSGNAPPGTPHLHFAVFELDADRRSWRGRALDPYEVFRR